MRLAESCTGETRRRSWGSGPYQYSCVNSSRRCAGKPQCQDHVQGRCGPQVPRLYPVRIYQHGIYVKGFGYYFRRALGPSNELPVESLQPCLPAEFRRSRAFPLGCVTTTELASIYWLRRGEGRTSPSRSWEDDSRSHKAGWQSRRMALDASISSSSSRSATRLASARKDCLRGAKAIFKQR